MLNLIICIGQIALGLLLYRQLHYAHPLIGARGALFIPPLIGLFAQAAATRWRRGSEGTAEGSFVVGAFLAFATCVATLVAIFELVV